MPPFLRGETLKEIKETNQIRDANAEAKDQGETTDRDKKGLERVCSCPGL